VPRLEGKSSSSPQNILLIILALLVIFAIVYFAYLKPQNILDLGFI